MDAVSIYVLGSVVLVSMISLIGLAVFSLFGEVFKRSILYLVSFSTGTLLGSVFIHMIPEMSRDVDFFTRALLLVLAGIVGSFVIEKIIRWRHCHMIDCDQHIHPVGFINLVGDGVHNFVDGMLIAGSYIVSVPLGITTTIAVIIHEIPQEVGDFAILIHSGFTRVRALLFNFLFALTSVIGAVIVLLFRNSVPDIGIVLLPLTAGNFLYIAGSDLIPELHKEVRIGKAIIQLLCMVAGIGLMYVV